MFDVLIREAASRFNLGDKAGPLVRAIADAIFDSGNGGFDGMRGRFADAGLGELFASWIGTTPGDNVLQPDQFSAGFGETAAHGIAERQRIPVAAVNMAGAWLLPKMVGLLTPGGTIPNARPADYDRWFAVAPVAAAAVARPPAGAASAPGAHVSHTPADAPGGGWWKWLLGLVVVGALAFFGMRACQPADAPVPSADPAPVTEPAVPAPVDTAPVAPPPAADAPAQPDAATALSNLKPGGSIEDLLAALNLMIIHFDTGSANISSESLDILGKAAEAIKAMPPETRIEVGGHTDNTGNAAANMTLSQQRADAVVAKLGELGVAQGVLTAEGYGQDKPVADNATEDGKARNRRIEFTVGD